MDKKIREGKIREVVARSMDQVAEIVREADDLMKAGAPVDKDMSLVVSGISLGYIIRDDLAESESNDEKEGDPTPREFVKVLEEQITIIDSLPVGQELALKHVADMRNPLASLLSRIKDARATAVLHRMTRMFGPVMSVIGTNDEVGDDLALEISVAVSRSMPAMFAGYIKFRDDASISCRCVYHLGEAYQNDPSETGETDAKARKEFGTYSQALIAYGKWFVKDIRELLSSGGEDSSEHAPFDAGLVEKESSGLFSRLVSGKAGE